MSALKIVTTEQLAEELGITTRQVLLNVKKKRWKPLMDLGRRPYRFDLAAIEGQLKSGSLTTESRLFPDTAKSTLHIPARKRKGDKRKLWPR